MAMRLNVGLYAFVGLLIGCATERQAASPPNTAQAACGGQDTKSCLSPGLRYLKGLGVPKDERRAATLFEQSCSSGETKGCYILGGLYEIGLGVAKDERRAATLFEQACTGGLAVGCSDLGGL